MLLKIRHIYSLHTWSDSRVQISWIQKSNLLFRRTFAADYIQAALTGLIATETAAGREQTATFIQPNSQSHMLRLSKNSYA